MNPIHMTLHNLHQIPGWEGKDLHPACASVPAHNRQPRDDACPMVHHPLRQLLNVSSKTHLYLKTKTTGLKKMTQKHSCNLKLRHII